MTDADRSLALAERIDAACDRFETAWRAGHQPRIDDYLAQSPESDREALRQTLLAIEAELSRGSVATSTASDTAPLAPQPAEPNPQRLGRFEVRALLGAGAFGRVFRAFDPQLGREVAVKVPLQNVEDRDRFLREARAAAGLRHPNICPVHEVGEHDGTPYIVMTLIPGQSLAEAIKTRSEPLSEKQVAQIVRKLALALDVAHKKGVVHRDLKPANVMIDRETRDLVVMDFGLARAPQLGDAAATKSGTVMGTPSYMSPEQARGDGKAVGPRSDLYSLGVMMYELLTGRRPFLGTATEVIGQILHIEPDPPTKFKPALDPLLVAACQKAMAKDPAARFASMKEFAAAMDAYLRQSPTASTETTRAIETQADPVPLLLPNAPPLAASHPPAPKMRSRKRLFVLVALLLGGTLATLGGVIFFARTKSATVLVDVDVDLSDKTLSFTLDGKPVTPEELKKPIELTVGPHTFLAKRGEAEVRRIGFRVSKDAGERIEITEDTGPEKKPAPPVPSTIPPSPPAPVAVKPGEVDRKAAEWVRRMNGIVWVRVGDGEAYEVQPNADLPDKPFRLTQLQIDGPRPLDKTGFDLLEPLTDLTHITIAHADLTDDDILRFGTMPLAKTVTDIYFGHSRLTDRGFESLAGWTNLRLLNYGGPQVRMARLEKLQGLKLRGIILPPMADDAMLAKLSLFPDLQYLPLHEKPITNAGMVHLTKLPKLDFLIIDRTGISDEGLRTLQKCSPTLTKLFAYGTKVTPEGLEEFRKARPSVYLGPQPQAVLNRLAAQEVLDLGGVLTLHGDPKVYDGRLDPKPKLPTEAFRIASIEFTDLHKLGHEHFINTFASLDDLKRLTLTRCTLPSPGWTDIRHGKNSVEVFEPISCLLTDANLGAVAVLSSLKSLNLTGNPIHGTGLDALARLKNLEHLILNGAPLTEPGLAKLATLPLKRLDLTSTELTATGLQSLAKMKTLNQLILNWAKLKTTDLAPLAEFEELHNLSLTAVPVGDELVDYLLKRKTVTYLSLSGTKVGDAGVKKLPALPLVALDLSQTGVTDDGLKALQGVKSLRHLNLVRCEGVSSAGVVALQKALPNCNVSR